MIIANTRNLGSPITGVQRYTSEIIKRTTGDIQQVCPTVPLAGLMGHAWEQCILPGKLKNRLLWSPANTGPINYSNQVVTIHDLAVIDHPEWFNKKFAAWYRVMWSYLLPRVKGIITVSNFSRERIINNYQLDPEKVRVIYNGVSDFSGGKYLKMTSFDERIVIERPYILTVGSLEPRKNLKKIISAWAVFKKKNPDYFLVVVGESSSVFSKLHFDHHKDIIFTGRVTDIDLFRIYKGAACFIYISLYEGFGLPILEAMGCGVPVITSNTTALAEIAGGAALLVDPENIEDISAAMNNVCHNQSLHNALLQRAFERKSIFSWEKSATETTFFLQLNLNFA